MKYPILDNLIAN